MLISDSGHRFRRVVAFSMAALLFACSATPSPTPAPTAAPATVTPQSPPATALPATATLPPTEMPATASPTRSATATPQPEAGRIEDSKTSITFVLPAGWRKTERNGNLNLESGDGVIVLLFTDNGPPNFEADVDEFKKSVKGSVVKKLGAVTVGPNIDAQAADISSEDGRTVYRYIYIPAAGGNRIFIAVGAAGSLNTNASKIDALLKSMRFVNNIFGVPREQALVQVRGSPDPETLDPALASGSADDYVGHLFSGLVRLSPELGIEPDLAETWRAAPDGSVYTFTLRANTRFADGRAITAEDVRYSWERAADPATDSETFLVYLGDILGARDRREGRAATLRGLRVIDARTFEVTLDQAKTYFLAKLTYPTSFVVDRKDVENGGARWMFKPNASGPYQVRSYKEDEHFVFERNPNTYAQPELPYAVYNARPGGSSLSLYQAGSLDIVLISDKEAERLRSSNDPLAKDLQSSSSLCTSMLQIDINKAPLNDVHLRRALALALDVNGLSARFDQQDNARATTVLPPAMAGHRDLPDRVAFDPVAARAALAKSAHAAAPPVITVNFAGQGDRPNAYITAVADMWREHLGLRFEFQKLDARNFSRAAREQRGNIVSYGGVPIIRIRKTFSICSFTAAATKMWLATRARPLMR